jgi:hypothetical protein
LGDPQFVLSEQLDLLEKLRASTEPRRHLVVLRPRRPPPQDPSLERTEHVALYVHAAARVLGEAADLGDPLRVTTEPACDLNIIDAVVDQAENPALDGPKPVIVWHGGLLVGWLRALESSAAAVSAHSLGSIRSTRHETPAGRRPRGNIGPSGLLPGESP